MKEIKTRIDKVFEFVKRRKKTTLKEVSREVRFDGDELDKCIYVLSKHNLIKVQYGLFNTYIYAEEDNILRLVDEFKSQLHATANDAIVDKGIATDRNLKIMALRSMSME